MANKVPAGWYRDPTGRFAYRQWLGRWTSLVSDGRHSSQDGLPRRWMRVLGVALLVPAMCLPLLGFLAVYGDADPHSRSGITRADGQLEVVQIGCPNERIRGVELLSLGEVPSDERLLWQATGSGPMVERFPLGADLDGFTTDRSLTTDYADTDRLILTVKTTTGNRDDVSPSFAFSPRDVTEGVISTSLGRYDSTQEFRDDILEIAPCTDPYRTYLHFLAWWTGISAILAFAALILFRVSRRRDPELPLPTDRAIPTVAGLLLAQPPPPTGPSISQ